MIVQMVGGPDDGAVQEIEPGPLNDYGRSLLVLSRPARPGDSLSKLVTMRVPMRDGKAYWYEGEAL